jgi:hypothetical protein
MKYLKTYEGVRELMTGKSEDEIKKAIDNLTPWAALHKIQMSDREVNHELEKIADDRIKESEKELDKFFENINEDKLPDVLKKVVEWVEKNGGNPANLDYGFKELAEQIFHYSDANNYRHDSVVIYDESVVESFAQLLKNFALCEVRLNNSIFED